MQCSTMARLDQLHPRTLFTSVEAQEKQPLPWATVFIRLSFPTTSRVTTVSVAINTVLRLQGTGCFSRLTW